MGLVRISEASPSTLTLQYYFRIELKKLGATDHNSGELTCHNHPLRVIVLCLGPQFHGSCVGPAQLSVPPLSECGFEPATTIHFAIWSVGLDRDPSTTLRRPLWTVISPPML